MKISVLDHGYVSLVEAWGQGEAGLDDFEVGIIEAARQSTQGSFRGWEKDERLLRFLFMNKPPHASPFEFAGMVIEVQAPIFVYREWHRHRTQSYNEMSARYAPLPDLNYIPSIERLMLGSRQAKESKNKQAGLGSDAKILTEETARGFQINLIKTYKDFQEQYEKSLSMGVPKELARCGMPVGRYSRMRASTCLRNWYAFLTLRMHPAAQWEIQQYASAVARILENKFPRTWKLFEELKSAKD